MIRRLACTVQMPPNGLMYPPRTIGTLAEEEESKQNLKMSVNPVQEAASSLCYSASPFHLLAISRNASGMLLISTGGRGCLSDGCRTTINSLYSKRRPSRSRYKAKEHVHYSHLRNGKLPQCGMADTTKQCSYTTMDSKLHLQKLYPFIELFFASGGVLEFESPLCDTYFVAHYQKLFILFVSVADAAS
ncbi:hypothetical protein EDC04DRAFT_2143218 [Pisolithus marmoratus]|nr:hypothetical protein EDC04DRAFT_2143218 [Pisolithus marmoratus]